MIAEFLLMAEALTASGQATPLPEKNGCEISVAAKSPDEAKRLLAAKGEPVTLLARCGSAVALLGRADKYELIDRPSLGVAAAAITTDGRVRIIVVSPSADGSPLVEDYTRSLARSVGLNPDRDLSLLQVDLSSFKASGHITALAKGHGQADVSIDDRVLGERQRMGATNLVQ